MNLAIENSRKSISVILIAAFLLIPIISLAYRSSIQNTEFSYGKIRYYQRYGHMPSFSTFWGWVKNEYHAFVAPEKTYIDNIKRCYANRDWFGLAYWLGKDLIWELGVSWGAAIEMAWNMVYRV